MKKIFSLLIALVLINECQGQAISDKSAEKNIYNFSFNLIKKNNNTTSDLLDSVLYYYFDTLNFDWVCNGKLYYNYNLNICTIIGKSFNGFIWENTIRVTKTFDIFNNEIVNVIELWDGVFWVKYNQDLYTYDGNHNHLTNTHQVWNNGGWENSTKSIMTYNNLQKIESSESSNWVLGAWVYQRKNIYSYVGNNLMNRLDYVWNGLNWDWSTQSISSFDINNNLISCLNQQWINNSWQNLIQSFIGYDVNNKIVSSISQTWYLNTWLNTTKRVYGYDSLGNKNLEVLLAWTSIAWDTLNSRYNFYDLNTNLILSNVIEYSNNYVINRGIDSLFYSSKIQGVQYQDKNILVQVSPNPFNESIFVLNKSNNGNLTYKLMDAQGKIVMSGLTESISYRINTTDLSSGVYFFTLFNESNQTQMIYKLVK